MEPTEGPLIRESDRIGYFAGEKGGIIGLQKYLEYLAIVYRFFPSTWHQSRLCAEGTYYQVLDNFLSEANFSFRASFLLTTKWVRFRTDNYGSTLADPSLVDGSFRRTNADPELGARVRVGFREPATKAMIHDNFRGHETPELTAEATTNDDGCRLVTDGGRERRDDFARIADALELQNALLLQLVQDRERERAQAHPDPDHTGRSDHAIATDVVDAYGDLYGGSVAGWEFDPVSDRIENMGDER